jgi:hypothetical protein
LLVKRKSHRKTGSRAARSTTGRETPGFSLNRNKRWNIKQCHGAKVKQILDLFYERK